MASDFTERAGLTPHQQEALDQYIGVTAQAERDAIALLQRSEWNVQIAIAKYFDGEGPDPLAEAIAAQQAPAPAARFENLQESLHASPQASSAQPREAPPHPAPRIVPQRERIQRPHFLLTLLFTPFTLGYRVASVGIRLALYILSFLPRPIRPTLLTNAMATGFRSTTGRRMLLPADTAARFKREFEEEYGPNELPWFDGGFAQAQDLAKKELKFLLFVLVSPEHDETESFTKETLLSPEVVEFLKDPANDIILWGGNVLDSEAYQVSTEYNCTKFPFSGLVCLTPKHGSTRMGTVKRLVGPMPPSRYLGDIRSAIEKYAPELASVRAERAARDAVRNIRTEQDSAYERSLAVDRERARERREAAARAAEEERRLAQEAEEAARKAEKREQWRRWRVGRIAPEPTAGTKDSVRVALKFSDSAGGKRVIRRFEGDATMEELYAFAECHDLLTGGEAYDDAEEPEDYQHEYQFALASLMPRQVYGPSKTDKMREVIGTSGNLIMEDL
ncbi:hypothetical protein jhhlp_001386 [Lomentospora prolificans]|uniref:UAS domain-containing protein n=1 Tax=Lomentospora prolificans TaxID=41688 RepID=A0A2N3NI33_9PEZI|nr:hypothetical protein jhhlp_001386 [Lomentospora prolificans]